MSTRADFSFPAERPAGLETAAFSAAWWRIDATHPDDWAWEPHPAPQGRFDPASGRFRVRYAASSPVAAARECFPDRTLGEAEGELWLVRVEGEIEVLDLTDVKTLDALGVDDRISTGRLDEAASEDPLLARAQILADAVWDWWDGDPPAFLYRTQSTPIARSLAFHSGVGWETATARRLREASSLLHPLVHEHGFRIPDWPVTGGRDRGPDEVNEVAPS